ncbi:MAG: bactofilin family protein, partial [bacterium]
MDGYKLAAVIALVLVLALPIPALAFVPRAGNTVVVTEQVRDDLYIAGGTVEVSGEVDGDVVAAGGTLTLSGPVTGGILASGGTVTIRGSIGRSLRAVGGTLAVAGPIGADAVLAGGNVTVERGAEVGRDLVVAGGNIQVSASVHRNAYLTGGSVTIAGTIDGNVDANADEIVLLPSARINGQLRYSSGRPIEIQPGAQVAGQVTRVTRPSRSRSMLNPASRFGVPFAGRVIEGMWLLVIGFIMVAVAPRAVHSVKEQVGRRFGMSLLTGCILAIVVPFVVILLLVTFIGIPVALVVIFLYFATVYPGQLFVTAWLGEWIVQRLGRREGAVSLYLTVALGVLVLMILVALPFIGWLFRLLAIFTGFGALWAAIWRVR